MPPVIRHNRFFIEMAEDHLGMLAVWTVTLVLPMLRDSVFARLFHDAPLPRPKGILPLDPINENHHARVAERVAPRALGQHMAQFRHNHVGAVALDQLGRVVLPCPPAFIAFDPHQR